jgi:hypothetical protein
MRKLNLNTCFYTLCFALFLFMNAANATGTGNRSDIDLGPEYCKMREGGLQPLPPRPATMGDDAGCCEECYDANCVDCCENKSTALSGGPCSSCSNCCWCDTKCCGSRYGCAGVAMKCCCAPCFAIACVCGCIDEIPTKK